MNYNDSAWSSVYFAVDFFIFRFTSGCEPGTYNNDEGQHECKECPSGYYCLGNTTDYVPFLCPKGHYCPRRTPNPHYKQCPPGTYNDLIGGQNISACRRCTPGHFCSGWGNVAPTGPCLAGRPRNVKNVSTVQSPVHPITIGLVFVAHFECSSVRAC